jgi:transposase-like protein
VSADLTLRRDPRKYVQIATIEQLVDVVVSSAHPFGVYTFDDGTWFVCPRCSKCNSTGGAGTARIVDAWRWRCTNCRFTGTRIVFENVILENADLLEQLYEFVGGES